MHIINNKRGFNLTELSIVMGIVSILIIIAVPVSSKLFQRRSIDKMTYQLSSTLNLAKLRAARHGVEHQTVCEYNSTNKTLTIETQRGNSNKNTDFGDSANYEVLSNLVIEMDKNYTVLPAKDRFVFHFNPNGTSSALSVNFAPTDQSNIKKCGKLVLSPFGRIRTVIGNWNFNTQSCIRIADEQAPPM